MEVTCASLSCKFHDLPVRAYRTSDYPDYPDHPGNRRPDCAGAFASNLPVLEPLAEAQNPWRRPVLAACA